MPLNRRERPVTYHCRILECGNQAGVVEWQTHRIQNPAPLTGHVGSTPTFGTLLGFVQWSVPFRQSVQDERI